MSESQKTDTRESGLYDRIHSRVESLREAGFEPDKIVVSGGDWDSVRSQATVVEGEGYAGSDEVLINGVRAAWRSNQKGSKVIFEVEP